MASTVAASPGLKKYQPSGLTGRGGSPAKGDQGDEPDRLRPSAVAVRIGNDATDASSRRRLSTREFFFIYPSGLRSVNAATAPFPLRFCSCLTAILRASSARINSCAGHVPVPQCCSREMRHADSLCKYQKRNKETRETAKFPRNGDR